jgi:hypothetical protein
VAAADRLTYPASPVWRNPEAALVNVAASVFVAAFAAFGVVAAVGGAVADRPAPVIFGILWSAGLPMACLSPQPVCQDRV